VTEKQLLRVGDTEPPQSSPESVPVCQVTPGEIPGPHVPDSRECGCFLRATVTAVVLIFIISEIKDLTYAYIDLRVLFVGVL
jgi:hypothetical protein